MIMMLYNQKLKRLNKKKIIGLKLNNVYIYQSNTKDVLQEGKKGSGALAQHNINATVDDRCQLLTQVVPTGHTIGKSKGPDANVLLWNTLVENHV